MDRRSRHIAGPVAEAALKTVQQHQESFFGKKLSSNTAVGAVTSALLGAAAEGDIGDVFTPEGTVRLYRSVLELSVKNPRLFIGTDGPKSDIARDLLVRIGGAIQNAPPGIDKKLAGDVAIAAIESLKVNVPGLLRIKDDAWRNIAGDLTAKVLTDCRAGIGAADAQKAFEIMFSPEETVELLSIVMKQVVQTPGMIAGVQVSDEAQALVATIAGAIAARGSELLTPEDWKAVAQTIAVEVARNPGRIISLGNKPEQQLAGKLLQVLLSSRRRFISGWQAHQCKPAVRRDPSRGVHPRHPGRSRKLRQGHKPTSTGCGPSFRSSTTRPQNRANRCARVAVAVRQPCR